MRLCVLISALCLLTLSIAVAQWQPEVRLTNDPGASLLPNPNNRSIAATGDTVRIVFVDNRSGKYLVYYMRSLDAGVTWDSAVPLSGDSDRVFRPALAAQGTTVHVTWPTGTLQAMMYRRSTDAGATWSAAETLVSSPAGLDDPCLSADGNNVGLTWGDGRDGNWNGELYYKQSSDGGLTWTPDTRLTFGPDTCVDKEACLVVAGAYRYIIWTRWHWHTSVSQTWFMRSTDGGANWQPRTRVTDDTTFQEGPEVEAVGANIHAVWHDGRADASGIYYRHSGDNGATWGPEQWLGDTLSYDDFPTLATAGRNVHVVWRNTRSSQFDLGYRRSTDNGATWAPDTLLTDDPADDGTPCLAASGDRVHLLWYGNLYGNYEIFYKQNPTGSGVEESPRPQASSRKLGPTIVRGVLFLPHSLLTANCSLLSPDGRKVLDLSMGQNDVSRLAPGVYFVRWAAGGARSAVSKVIVSK